MNMDTLDEAIAIKKKIEHIDKEIAKWDKNYKLQLAYTDWDITFKFDSHLIPIEIYNSFKNGIINHLKAEKLDLLEKLGKM